MNLEHNALELFIDELRTLNAWLQQPCYLLTSQNFKGGFRHEEAWRHRCSIFDSGLDVLLCQIFKWIHFHDRIFEDLVEDKVDSGTSETLAGDIPDEVSIKFIVVFLDEPSDQMQDDRSHILFVYCLEVHVVHGKLPFFLLYCQRDLFCQVRHTHLYMANQVPIQRLGQVRNSHFGWVLSVNSMSAKEIRFFLHGVFNQDIFINLLLRPAFDAEIAKL